MQQVRCCLSLSCASNTRPDAVRASSSVCCGHRRSQPRWVAAAKDDTSGEEEAELVQMDAVRVLPPARLSALLLRRRWVGLRLTSALVLLLLCRRRRWRSRWRV